PEGIPEPLGSIESDPKQLPHRPGPRSEPLRLGGCLHGGGVLAPFEEVDCLLEGAKGPVGLSGSSGRSDLLDDPTGSPFARWPVVADRARPPPTSAIGPLPRHSRTLPLKRRRAPKWGPSSKMSGGDLLSHPVSRAVPSALEGLTSGFGMGPGVSPPLWPPKRWFPTGNRPIRSAPGIRDICESASLPGSVPRNSIASASKSQVLGLLV